MNKWVDETKGMKRCNKKKHPHKYARNCLARNKNQNINFTKLHSKIDESKEEIVYILNLNFITTKTISLFVNNFFSSHVFECFECSLCVHCTGLRWVTKRFKHKYTYIRRNWRNSENNSSFTSFTHSLNSSFELNVWSTVAFIQIFRINQQDKWMLLWSIQMMIWAKTKKIGEFVIN